MAKKEQEKPGLNIIAKAAIMEEAIKKEMRHHKLTTVFSINPHNFSKWFSQNFHMLFGKN